MPWIADIDHLDELITDGESVVVDVGVPVAGDHCPHEFVGQIFLVAQELSAAGGIAQIEDLLCVLLDGT